MKRKVLFIVLALLLCATLVLAQEPIYDHFVYLPVVIGGSGVRPTPAPPTVTPTVRPTLPPPTVTPVPTKTPIPTEAPTVTPTATPSGTVVLPTLTPTPMQAAWADNGYAYEYSARLYVLGEVHNEFSTAISWPEVPITLYDEGQPVYLNDEWIARTVGSGDSVCFKHIVWSPPEEWDSFEFGTVTHWGGTFAKRPLNLSLSNLQGTYSPWSGDYVITGNVTNNESEIVENVRLVATLKNAEGQVVGCDEYNSPSSPNLYPGQTSPFTIMVYGWYRDYSDVTSFRVQTYGTLDD